MPFFKVVSIKVFIFFLILNETTKQQCYYIKKCVLQLMSKFMDQCLNMYREPRRVKMSSASSDFTTTVCDKNINQFHKIMSQYTT